MLVMALETLQKLKMGKSFKWTEVYLCMDRSTVKIICEFIVIAGCKPCS